jgi:hypothetical protein
MSVIASRQLPVFFDAETSTLDKEKLFDLMGPSSKGSMSDKLRLLAVLNMRADSSTMPLIHELEDVLKKQGEASEVIQAEINSGLAAIKHMRQIRQFQSPPPTQVNNNNKSSFSIDYRFFLFSFFLFSFSKLFFFSFFFSVETFNPDVLDLFVYIHFFQLFF